MTSTMTRPDTAITVGVDTHKDLHVAAALDGRGAVLGTESFCATAGGYEQLRCWADRFGEIGAVGVEGTGSWGAGLTPSPRRNPGSGDRGEPHQPSAPPSSRQVRHRRRDRAARAVQSGEATAVPKSGSGPVEAVRALRVTMRSAVKARTQAVNQMRSLLDVADPQLRSELGALNAKHLAARCPVPSRHRCHRPGSRDQDSAAQPRSPLPGAHHRDQRTPSAARHRRASCSTPGVARRTRRRNRHRSRPVDRRGRQPTPDAQRRRARSPVRCRPRRCQQRTTTTTPPQPGRQPTRTAPCGASCSSDGIRPPDPRLHRPPSHRGQNQTRGHPIPQTTPRPPLLETPHPTHLTTRGASESPRVQRCTTPARGTS